MHLQEQQWQEKGEEFEKQKGFKVLAGDFNCVTNTRLDKIGGNKKKGTEGAEEQRVWENKLEVVDVWRKVNPGIVAATWTSRDKDKKK